MIESSIFIAFCGLQLVMVSVERAWASCFELSGLSHAVADARHHCCAAASFLVEYEHRDAGPLYEEISGAQRVIAHEAYLSLIALGQMMISALEDELPGTPEMERALDAIGRVLDTLEPFTSRADRASRGSLLGSGPRIEPRRAS